MKKLMAIALALLFLFSLTACREKEPAIRPFENITLPTTESTVPTDASATEQTSAPSETEEPTDPTPEEPTTGAEGLVDEYYNDAGEYEFSYDDNTSDTLFYSFHLPEITESTKGALAINRSITETFGALIEEEYKAMEETSNSNTIETPMTLFQMAVAFCLGNIHLIDFIMEIIPFP